MSRTIGSSASERAFQASQSLFTLRQVRRVLADRAAEQGGKRTAHTTRIGAGEVAARDQRIGCQRAALIGPQRPALPFGRLALEGVQSSARHVDLDRPEGACQRSLPAPVAMPHDTSSFFIAGRLASSITRPGQGFIELAADQFFDELPSPIADFDLDRIEPIVKKMGSRLCFRLQGIRLRGNARHGVVSSPTR
jgi:hypothetical protein